MKGGAMELSQLREMAQAIEESLDYMMVLSHMHYRSLKGSGERLLGSHVSEPLFSRVRELTGHQTGCPCCGREDLPLLTLDTGRGRA
jgi:hypothetical protein